MTCFDLAALDPAKDDCAIAAGNDRRLAFVADGLLEIDARDLYVAVHVVWEIPQGDGRGVPVEDLLAVAANGAATATALSTCLPAKAYRPREWKGSVPKPVHHSWMWETLSSAERAVLGGLETFNAIEAACLRGAQDRWKKPGAAYYRAKDLPTVDGQKITHDILDAAALYLFAVGRLKKGKSGHAPKTPPTRRRNDRPAAARAATAGKAKRGR